MSLRAFLVAVLTASAAPALAEAPTIAVVSQNDGVVRMLPLAADDKPLAIEVGELPAGIAVGPDGRTLYVTHPDRGRVSVLDAVTNRITASFAVKGQPFGAAANDEFLYVTDWTRSVVIKIDVLTGATLAETPVGKAPASIVLDKAGRRAFVAARESNAVGIVDLARGEETGRISVGKAPFALALSPDQSRLYVANVQSNDLSVIDIESGQELKRLPVGKMPYGVAVSPDGARLAVTLQHDNALAIVDAKTLEVTARVKVGGYPEGVSISPDGRQAAVANWFDDTVSLVDLDAAKVASTLPAAGGPRNVLVLQP